MAHTALGGETAETTKERALATERQSQAVSNSDVQRITYGDRTIEVPKIDHAALGRPVDKQFDRNKASVETRLKAIGVLTATVVNFLPIYLVSDSTLHPLKPTQARIPAPKDKEEYGVFIFADAHIEPTRQGIDSPLLAWEYHPIELASEFSRLHPKGVMTFIGIPSDLDDPAFLKKKSPEEQHHGMTYGQVLENARQSAIEYMQGKLREGNEDERLKRNPSEPSKASARRLKVLGMIEGMPTWVEKQRDVMVKIPNCPNCQRPCEPGAAQCTNNNCNYIIDPKRAYEISAIGEDHPSLERLTRVQVKELGISDYVAETIDEKRVRLDTPGIMKPLSLVAQRLKDSEEEFAAIQRKQDAQDLAKALKPAKQKEE